MLAYVNSACGKDTLKQQQLCKLEALYQRYLDPEIPQAKSALRPSEKISIVDAAIVAGVRDMLQKLKARHIGQYSHHDRILHNALTTAAGWKAGMAISFCI